MLVSVNWESNFSPFHYRRGWCFRTLFKCLETVRNISIQNSIYIHCGCFICAYGVRDSPAAHYTSRNNNTPNIWSYRTMTIIMHVSDVSGSLTKETHTPITILIYLSTIIYVLIADVAIVAGVQSARHNFHFGLVKRGMNLLKAKCKCSHIVLLIVCIISHCSPTNI